MHGAPTEVFSNRTALAQTNLEQPAALQLFDSLCQKGILKTSLPVPHNLAALEAYIAELPFSKTKLQGPYRIARMLKSNSCGKFRNQL